ncbi:MAG: glycosyltransferase [Cyanobacteria bacterium J06623_7]
MKVLHVIPSLSPALGGPTQVALQTVKALRTQGIEAEIVTTNHNRATLADLSSTTPVEYEDVPVWFLPVTSTLKEYFFSTRLTKWLWKHTANYDLLDNHYLFSYAPTCAAAIARRQKIPYTVRTQGQLTPWALKQSRWKKRLYTLAIEYHNLHQAAAIHCTTQQEAIDLRNFGIITPAITLPLGIELTTPIPDATRKLREQFEIPCDRQIILFLSRLHPKKRPDMLIKAFQQLADSNPLYHLVMAGSGDSAYEQYLQQLAEKYDLGDRITFTGFVTGYSKNLLLQGADIFVLPSYSENFGIAVAEAMASGLPVIITSGVQISNDIAAANAGIVVNSQPELVNAIRQLLESTTIRSRLAKNAVKLTQDKYSWDIIARQLIEHYRQVVKK